MSLLGSVALFLFPIIFVIYVWNTKSTKAYPLPPGPRKLPLVQNLFDMPRKGFVWLEYAEISRKYNSDIIHLSALGNSIVVLNSAKLVSDLLEKRSSIYSSRPHAVMLRELMGWGDYLVFRLYDAGWKAQRKIISQAFPSDIGQFQPKLLTATHDLLRSLRRTNDVAKDLHSWAALFTMDVVYGMHPGNTESYHSYMVSALKAVESIAHAGSPGAYYVDQVPICVYPFSFDAMAPSQLIHFFIQVKYIPEYFPGATFKRQAKEWNALRIRTTEEAFGVVKERVVQGTASRSLTSAALEQISQSDDVLEQEEHIKKASMTAFGGGIDTTVAALEAFIAAMLMNPHVQKQAQLELDKVLGPGDLPTFSDEPLLPYITAVVRETLRYQPVTPLGQLLSLLNPLLTGLIGGIPAAIPHALTQDDVYEGYFIPKGSVIIPNVWSILHNDKDYPNPNQFNPSRFLDARGKLDPDVKDPSSAAFGFGRRICVRVAQLLMNPPFAEPAQYDQAGKHIAVASIFIAIASILACYVIEPELDEHGKPVEPQVEWDPAPTLLNRTLHLRCRFIPRSKEIKASLRV
ncbi:hypothetical protein D9757_007868 [Collybiopsis confluens]|uniref:Cytochrome P450 n=1 Tax=Collybiopsis confluens TaxID=2823264 RepID=A0A8H5M4U0_9AGAR|nr:hypothetical protein D9757_007868 [Collybiopsis confluens]